MRDYFLLAMEELCPGVSWTGMVNSRRDFETNCYKTNSIGEPDYNANNFGATWEQIPLIETAKKQGCYVLATDPNPKAGGLVLADESVHVDPRNLTKLMEVAAHFKPDGITSNNLG